MNSETSRRGAVDLLGHFLPQHVLRRLREQALSFEREERFRAYVLRRAWFALPLLLVFAAVGTACALGAAFLLFRLPAPLSASWFRTAVFCLGAAVWVAVILIQAYWLFGWLERRALRAFRSADAPESSLIE
jgi:heme A synthase